MTEQTGETGKVDKRRGRLAAIIFLALIVAPVCYALLKELSHNKTANNTTRQDTTTGQTMVSDSLLR